MIISDRQLKEQKGTRTFDEFVQLSSSMLMVNYSLGMRVGECGVRTKGSTSTGGIYEVAVGETSNEGFARIYTNPRENRE
jgi:hypothetical protein